LNRENQDDLGWNW